MQPDEPLGREVLVEMRATGVCHTHWDSLRWGRLQREDIAHDYWQLHVAETLRHTDQRGGKQGSR